MTRYDEPTERTTETRTTETRVRADVPPEHETRVSETERRPEPPERAAGWATEVLARAAVALFGVALLLFALGQLVGVDLLSAVSEFLTTAVGAWVLVAVFALLLIFAASKRWGVRRPM